MTNGSLRPKHPKSGARTAKKPRRGMSKIFYTRPFSRNMKTCVEIALFVFSFFLNSLTIWNSFSALLTPVLEEADKFDAFLVACVLHLQALANGLGGLRAREFGSKHWLHCCFLFSWNWIAKTVQVGAITKTSKTLQSIFVSNSRFLALESLDYQINIFI